MSERIETSFDVTSWDQTPFDESAEGPHTARAEVRKRFHGPLEGESTGEALLCQADAEDPSAGAGYVVSEQVTGSLDGRSGSFVIQHAGIMGPDQPPTTFGNVVPGSGTGELAGLRGTVEIARTPEGEHTMTLEYELG